MPVIATFLDTTLPDYASKSKELLKAGYKKVPRTRSNRKTIQYKYYEYLVNTYAGVNASLQTPEQLKEVWDEATSESEKYEMYIQTQAAVNAMNLNNSMGAPPIVEESFASSENVERMQPGYVDIDDILAGFGKMELGGGKRKTRKHKTRKHKTHKRKTHRRKTHKRKTHKRKTHRQH